MTDQKNIQISLMSTLLKPDSDKTGDDLKAQRFRMLEDIARELVGEVVFPTHFDAVVRLRNVLQDPGVGIATVASAVLAEPLISAKLLRLANSVVFNPDGHRVVDLKPAIIRLGLNVVRSAALSIAMTQLMRAKGMVKFYELTRVLWQHSIKTASAARLIAKTMTRFNPEEAMVAGLVHDLGGFYLLYRATHYEELLSRPESLRYLIMEWHESIGVSLLNALGLPDEIVDATVDHDQIRTVPATPRNLADVVYVANMLAGGCSEWLDRQLSVEQAAELEALEQKYGHLRADIEVAAQEMSNALS